MLTTEHFKRCELQNKMFNELEKMIEALRDNDEINNRGILET